MTARPGQRRFFKCTSHCSATAARFEVYCPDVISREYGFSEICYPTAKSTPKADREIISEFVTDKYKIEELGSGMCAPDHDSFYHNRNNPYRITDYKDVPDAESCKNECFNTEGCTGFSFSTKPTLVYRSIVETRDCYYAGTESSLWGGRTPDNMLGNGVRQTRRVSAVECLQICEEQHNRATTNILSGTLYAAGVRWHTDSGMSKGGCTCRGPGTTYNLGSYNCNAKSMKFSATQSATTCVLSTDGCDEPVLLGDGKCKYGDDYAGKTIEECEQLCIDDNYCRVFSWKPRSVSTSRFKKISSGTCGAGKITNAAECELAIQKLGFNYVDARSMPTHPSGCNMAHIGGGQYSAYFNTAGVEDCSARGYECACKDEAINCRISGRDCHYIDKRLVGEDILSDDRPPVTTMEHDYVLLLAGVIDHLGHNAQSNSPVCRGDCDAGEC